MIFILAILFGAVCFTIYLSIYSYLLQKSLKNRESSYRFNLEDIKDSDLTDLDRVILEFGENNQGLGVSEDALALLKENTDAFIARLTATNLAGRSIDLMYYIFDDDYVGKIFLSTLIEAADRGVRIRILIDDMNVGPRDRIFHSLSKHPNIEIRLFNPLMARGHPYSFKRLLEYIFRAVSLTHRMHNKAYIVDGRVAFVGGRNIADVYFGVSDKVTARDLDVMLMGDCVTNTEQIFDTYWNNSIVIPVMLLTAKLTRRVSLEYWREYLRSYLKKAKKLPFYVNFENRRFQDFLRAGSFIFKPEKVQVLADPPQKALGQGHNKWLVQFIFKKIMEAKHELQITSPYFVPGDGGVELLRRVCAKGVDVKVLTNSLSTTDVVIAYAGYSHYRKSLLKYGVKLYELRAICSKSFYRFHLFARNKASLHTKAFLIDQKKAFVGSFNFDMRSASLNTEMGVYFECDKIAAHMDLLFYEEISPPMSYKISLGQRGKVRWQIESDSHSYSQSYDPETKRKLRILVKLLSWLPIKSQL